MQTLIEGIAAHYHQGFPIEIDTDRRCRLEAHLLEAGDLDYWAQNNRLRKILRQLNDVGITEAVLPAASFRSTPHSVIPAVSRPIELAEHLLDLSDAIIQLPIKSKNGTQDLRGLPEDGLVYLIFAMMVVEGPVSPWIALSTLLNAKLGYLNGNWLWAPAAPASRRAFFALSLRTPLKHLLIEYARRRISTGGVNHNRLVDLQALGIQAKTPIERQNALYYFLKSFNGSTAFTSFNTIEAIMQQIAEICPEGLGSWNALQAAGEFIWTYRGAPPAFIRCLYSCNQPGAPAVALCKGISRRPKPTSSSDDDKNYFNTAKYRRIKLSQEEYLQRIYLSEETKKATATHAQFEIIAKRQHEVFCDYVQDIIKNKRCTTKAQKVLLEKVRDCILADIGNRLPDTSLLHYLIRWFTNRLKAGELTLRSLQKYYSTLCIPYLIPEGLDYDIAKWDVETLDELVLEMMEDQFRSHSSQMSSLKLLDSFIRYVKKRSAQTLLADVEIYLDDNGDVDFNRRTCLPTPKALQVFINKLYKNQLSDKYDDCTRKSHAAAFILMGYAGLRIVEALNLRYRDFDLVGFRKALENHRSKTSAGHRRLFQKNIMDDRPLRILCEILQKNAQDPRKQDRLVILDLDQTTSEDPEASDEKRLDILYASLIRVIRAELGDEMDLHTLRHFFATYQMIDLINQFKDEYKRGITPYPVSSQHTTGKIETRFVELLKMMGHRSQHTFFAHYFHGGEVLREWVLRYKPA